MNIDDYMFPTDDELDKDTETPDLDKDDDKDIELPVNDPELPDNDDSPDEDAVSYFEYLKVNNVLDVPEDFEFDGTPESIQKAMEVTKSNLTAKVAENIWNSLPDDFKPLLKYGLEGGNSLQAYLNAYTPVNYSDADIDDVITQKIIIKDYYKAINPNYQEDKIDRMISNLEKMEDTSLKEEALEAIDYLKELRQTQQDQLIESAKQDKIEREKKSAAAVAEITDLIEKTPQDSLRKNRIKNVLFQPVKKGQTTTTEFNHALDSILSTPSHLVQLAELLADYDPRVGFNFTRLTKQLETKSTKKFKELMQSKLDTKTNVKGSPLRSNKDDFDLSK